MEYSAHIPQRETETSRTRLSMGEAEPKGDFK